MRKFKLFVSFEEEEKWLQEQARKGLILKKKRTFYNFVKSDPRNLIYAVDYRSFKSKSDYINYITMFEDFGWKHISGTKYSYEQYFCMDKIDNSETPSIYSDRETSVKRYKEKGFYSLFKAILWYLLFGNILDLKFNMILHPTTAFLTPGLWDRVGSEFWRGFFFELPFATLRILSFFFIIGYILYSLIQGLWSLKLSNIKSENN